MPPFVRNALQSDAFHEFLKLLTVADFGFEFRRFIIMAGFFELFGKFFGFSLLGFLGNLRFIGIDSGRVGQFLSVWGAQATSTAVPWQCWDFSGSKWQRNH